MAKMIKRANGTGSITKETGRRRNPFRVTITLGWCDDGKQIRKDLGYYRTSDDATIALSKYNANPYDISDGKTTFADIYTKWREQKFPTISASNIKGYEAAYKRCTFLYNKKFKDIGIDDLQYTIDTSDCNYPTLRKIKVLLNQIYAYALPRKLTDRDYSETLDIKKFKDKNPNKQNKKAFTVEEIERIKALSITDIAKAALMLIYSGVRIGELLNLKSEDCNLDKHYINIVNSKTESGIRKVPISDKTLGYWRYFNSKGNEYLLCIDNRDFSGGKGYTAFKQTYWTPFMDSLGMSGRNIHETRHTCATLLHKAEIYPAKINRILGHTGKTTAENVYTHLDVNELIEAINMI